MTMTLLAPGALALAALLAIPVVLHLFKPRRVRQTPFSSLRWLHWTPQKLSRRVQWHQVILFLLRAAFLSLLVLALTKPVLTPADGGGFRERFLVLDVSHSMSYRSAGTATPIERARARAAELIARNRPGDRTAVLLTGAHTRLLTPLSAEPETYLPAVAAVQSHPTATDLCTALPAIRGLLGQPRPGAAAEVWFLTDNPQNAWRQGPPEEFLAGLPLPVRVRVVDVSAAGPQNAWITRARLMQLGRPARRVLRVELGCVGDEVQERTVHLDAAAGLPARSQAVTLTPGQPVSVDFNVPQAGLESGLLRMHLEPSDALPADDEFLLNLDAQTAQRVLIVEGPAEASSGTAAGYHLRTALEALAETAGQSLSLTTVPAADGKAADFQRADAIFLADVPALSDDALSTLEERIRGGAGVAIFLGESGKPAFLNQRLFKPLQPAEGLLPAPLQPSEEVDGPPVPLTSVRWSHPLLAGLGDPVVGDLGQVRFRRWFEFTADLPEQAAVLARIDEGAPALVDWPLDAGRVVVLNTGAGDRWCDLPRRKSFVPFIDRLLAHLAGPVPNSFAVGDVVTLPVANARPGGIATLVTPGGQRQSLPLRSSGGGKSLLGFEATEMGVHRIEGLDDSPTVVVQASRGDSVLTPMDTATLQRWWEPAGCEVIRGDDLGKYLDAAGASHSLWPWLLLVAGLVLLAETYLVHRLCPRSNPRLVTNIVVRRPLSHPAARIE